MTSVCRQWKADKIVEEAEVRVTKGPEKMGWDRADPVVTSLEVLRCRTLHKETRAVSSDGPSGVWVGMAQEHGVWKWLWMWHPVALGRSPHLPSLFPSYCYRQGYPGDARPEQSRMGSWRLE